MCTLKCTEKRFTPLHFPPNLSPLQNLKEALNLPHGMYCIIRLLEILRLSAFKVPLYYPCSYNSTLEDVRVQMQSRKLKSRYGARNQFQEPSLELSCQAT